jgi:signal transduction histidine kinase
MSVLLRGRLQVVLLLFSSVVAALTVALNTVVIAWLSRSYLGEDAFGGLVQFLSERLSLLALILGILAALISLPITRAITCPITELVAAHNRLAQGDMTVRVDPLGSGEIAILGRSFNHMAETLQQTQQTLLHKERLASMGQLAAGVAHEINNPLATILLFSEAALRDTPANEPLRNDLHRIISETTRSKTIVAGLLNFSRQQEVLAQETDVHALLETAIEDVAHQPFFFQVHIIRRYAADLPAIQADPAQLRQAFINLLNNGAQAIAGQGSITLTTSLLGGQWVEIAITDTGCGIPSDSLDKLFTPFFTTKAPGDGTGLGLSIVYGIVKMHRGQITVHSEVGSGTTFIVSLPIRHHQGWGAVISPNPGEVIA